MQVCGTANSVIRFIRDRFNLMRTFASSGLVKFLDNSSRFIRKPPAFTNYLPTLASQFLKPDRQKLFMIRNTFSHIFTPLARHESKVKRCGASGWICRRSMNTSGLPPKGGSRTHIGDTQNVLMNRQPQFHERSFPGPALFRI